jgi:putative inorganic carbon (hco3(-)) transporter
VTTPDASAATPLPRRRLPAVTTVAAALIAAAAAVYSGLSMGTGNRLGVVLPLALFVAAALAVLACTRFGAFTYLVLGLRASIDLFKLSGSSAGNVSTNSAATRGLDPSSILGVLFLLAAGLWLAAQYSRHGHLKGSPLRLALVAFGTTGLLSVAGSAEPLVSFTEFLRLLAVVVMYAVLEQLVTTRRSLHQLLVTAYASMLFPLGYTLVRFGLGDPPSEVKGSFSRITGPFSQSTTFARYLAFMIVFGVAILPYLTRRARVAMAAALAISSVFLVLTLTRGAIIGAVVGLVVVAVVQRSRAMLVGFAVVALLSAVFVPALASRFAEVGSTRAVGGPPTGNTLAWRIGYWSKVLPLANANPVTGIGLNMTQYNTDDAKQPHNDVIRAYVETGALGLITYVAMLVALVRTGTRALRRAPPGSFDHAIAAGFLGCALAYVVQSLGANVMSNVVCVWYLIAFASAASFVSRHDSHASERAAGRPRPATGVQV